MQIDDLNYIQVGLSIYIILGTLGSYNIFLIYISNWFLYIQVV